MAHVLATTRHLVAQAAAAEVRGGVRCMPLFCARIGVDPGVNKVL